MSADPARLPGLQRDIPAPPDGLSRESRRLWRDVLGEYVLETHHREILRAGLEARDRMREAQAAIAHDGAYIDGRFGKKAHPALAVERDSRTAMLRAFRELGLDLEQPATSRPPTRWR